MPELTRRYVVMAMATEAPFDLDDPEGVFVLKPWKDPAALRALQRYAENCYPELAHDLAEWMRHIEAGTVVRGGVGRRNEPHVRPARAAAAAGARRSRATGAPARARAKAARPTAGRKGRRPASPKKKRPR